MGLLDELASKTFDEATATARGRRARREAARDLLVTELRTYSEKIERMRIALIDLAERMRRADLRQANEDNAIATIAAVIEAGRPAQQIDQACDELTNDAPLDRTEWTAVSVFLQDQIQRQLLGSSYAEAVMLAERSQQERRELDLAWAKVRPLLDDLVEVRVVIALRAHRHDLRRRLDDAMDAVHAYQRSTTADPAKDHRRQAALETITDAIRFADAWNALIGKVRNDSGRIQHL